MYSNRTGKGVVLPVVLFKLQFLHLYLAVVGMVFISAKEKQIKKKTQTKTKEKRKKKEILHRSKAQSLLYKRKESLSIGMCDPCCKSHLYCE